MRLPFVSRAVFEERIEADRQKLCRTETLLDRADRRVDHLMDQLLAMKLSGASIVRSVATNADGSVKKLERATRSSVQQAIDENKHASSNPRLRAYLGEWADKELRKDASAENEERILNRLRGWSVVSNKPNDDDDDDDDDLIALEN